jgi:hypothetical protein
VRDVEGLAGLVEAEGVGVLGQDLLQVEPRRLEEVAYGVLVLETVHAALDRATLRGDTRDILADQRRGQLLQVGRLLGRVRTGLLLGRHLAVGGPVEDLDPGLEGFRVGEVGLQRRQVEAALLSVGIVALDAVLLQERGDRAGGGQGRQEKAEEGETGKHERQPLRQPNRPRVAKVNHPAIGGNPEI